MGFWGLEVEPGKPYPFHSDNMRGILNITQATLGLGSSKERSIVQISVGNKSPIFLCSLIPNKIESCPLNLEVEDDELVAFSVIGPRSIHLSGFFVADDGDALGDDHESDSFGEDIAETETDESSEYDTEDEYADGFIDDSDLEMYPSSPVPNSGVVIEEIVDDEKPTDGGGHSKRPNKKNQTSNVENSGNSQQQIVVRGDTGFPVLESEDEDGFPISTTDKNKSDAQKAYGKTKEKHKKTEKFNMKDSEDGDTTSLKRKVESVDQDGRPKGKKKKLREQSKGESVHASGNDNKVSHLMENEKKPEEMKTESATNQVSHVENNYAGLANEKGVVDKKKKKQKKKKDQGAEGVTDWTKTATTTEKKNMDMLESGVKETELKSSQMRTFPNGLVIEELSMGKPDGKRASPGKQVSVHYIGKLRNNGKIFDSNVGRAPFKFRLGIGQVIKGWDVGVNGMRIGDKRRITIPPSMGYGAKRAEPIPPNSWLVFDVELVDVR
ncbi:Peptidylprolyl isomerase [Quillaja saponaria]|uniref:peptidylprolyl isomerase n=1 Tax=Quillaja saponaria TaxID=32244 RepID=A0AAD7Q673_QUISA|nr:Peptidylprolyl isomerase [Quillaja saponaria]KAJ7975570.1 Peptidylprolyl isomerase [Quillaja saponaria]